MNEEPTLPVEKKPDEAGGVYFSSSIKISDPESDEILVEIRGEQ